MATKCMSDGGNIASASVIDIIEKSWNQLKNGDELVCIGMGPGVVLCGAALKVRLLQAYTRVLSGTDDQLV